VNGSITVGKRIPIGAAIGGLCTFAFSVWNRLNPELAFDVAEVGGISTALVALTQILVVNFFGVTPSE